MPLCDLPASRPLLVLAGALLGLFAAQQVPSALADPTNTGQPAQGVAVLGQAQAVRTVIGAYLPPAHARLLEADGFGAWLQRLPLAPRSEPVRTWEGRVVPGDFHVVELPLVAGDLQQCADTAIRLRAEWLRAQGREDAIVFHATSGDAMPWTRYRDGEKAYEQGNRLAWRAAEPQTWDQYLSAVFMWAGTRSLRFDTVEDDLPSAGDVLVLPGSPGHAVIILAVSQRDDEVFVLAGQGYMPAQSFHIVRGPEDGWWRWNDGARIGPWDFPADSLRSWE